VNNSFWSTERFVEAVYKTLQPKPAAKPAPPATTTKKKSQG
jgi:hypothetical protein